LAVWALVKPSILGFDSFCVALRMPAKSIANEQAARLKINYLMRFGTGPAKGKKSKTLTFKNTTIKT